VLAFVDNVAGQPPYPELQPATKIEKGSDQYQECA
jgi:hypothetical protein